MWPRQTVVLMQKTVGSERVTQNLKYTWSKSCKKFKILEKKIAANWKILKMNLIKQTKELVRGEDRIVNNHEQTQLKPRLSTNTNLLIK